MAKPLIAIVGETGSGKSGLAMSVAKQHNGEIIAADSRTVYKGFDIGTAKPTKQDQQQVPHHLLDVVEPNQKFSAGQFQRLANQAIDDIHSRNKLPILVGGTGLYVDSVIFDFDFAGSADEALRAELNSLNIEELKQRVLQKQQQTGEEFGATTPELWKNKRHMIRFIEAGETPKNNQTLRQNTLVLGISRSKSEMRKRIEDRVEQMFRAGLRKEIDELVATYGWDNIAMSGIIYKLFKDYDDGKISMSQVKRQFVQKDLQYAKRQRTWFKRNPHIVWVESAEAGAIVVDEFLTTNN